MSIDDRTGIGSQDNRRQAAELGAELAADTTLLYGGSITATNADAYFSRPDIDGGLVGGASQELISYQALIDVTVAVYQRTRPAPTSPRA